MKEHLYFPFILWLFMLTIISHLPVILGEWHCHDGTDETEYRNWNAAAGQPDNWSDKEHCAQVLRSGSWNDYPCDSKLRAICQSAPSSNHSCPSGNPP